MERGRKGSQTTEAIKKTDNRGRKKTRRGRRVGSARHLVGPNELPRPDRVPGRLPGECKTLSPRLSAEPRWQKLPCKIKFDIPNAGHLEGPAEKHACPPLPPPLLTLLLTLSYQLREGTTIELPYWLAGTLSAKSVASLPQPLHAPSRITDTLHSPRRDMIFINLPKPYTARIRNALAASSESVNLRNLGGGGGAFYAGGNRLSNLCVNRYCAEDPKARDVGAPRS